MYISVDLDDTLLHKNKDLSDYTLNIIHKCQELGHKIIINTARNYNATIELMNIIKPDFTSINAGSMIYDKDGNLIRKNLFSSEKTHDIVKRLFPFCDYINIQTLDKLFTTRLSNNPNVEYYDGKNGYYFESGKILFYNGDSESIKRYENDLGYLYIKYHKGLWSRVSPVGSTKLEALKWIVNYDSGSMDDTISFGDDHGDLEMILGSKIGVCMDNAEEEVKQLSPNVCDHCDNDGVAKYLENLFKLKNGDNEKVF